MGIEHVLSATDALIEALAPLRFEPPVTHVYNPLLYARPMHDAYVRRFAAGPKRAVFLGMNPGPFGMAQTGVPFGEVAAVRDWLGLDEPIGRPEHEHPKRPVKGLACPQSEVSGRRLWGAVAARFHTAEAFFERYYVANYCPLVFMSASGANITPDKLPASERKPLFEACDAHLRALVEALEPTWVIGIGAFAEARAAAALAGTDVRVVRVLHPSPASPAANRGWEAAVVRELEVIGLCPQ